MKTALLVAALLAAGCNETFVELNPCDAQDCGERCFGVGVGACAWSVMGCSACVCLVPAEGDTWRMDDAFGELSCAEVP